MSPPCGGTLATGVPDALVWIRCRGSLVLALRLRRRARVDRTGGWLASQPVDLTGNQREHSIDGLALTCLVGRRRDRTAGRRSPDRPKGNRRRRSSHPVRSPSRMCPGRTAPFNGEHERKILLTVPSAAAGMTPANAAQLTRTSSRLLVTTTNCSFARRTWLPVCSSLWLQAAETCLHPDGAEMACRVVDRDID